MTYELAKQLKDAGYPISLMSKGCENCWGDLHQGCASDCKTIEWPTLSELIEAIDDFSYLSNRQDKGLGWEACGGGSADIRGATPEEAVARLWLALNSKDDKTSS
jgi:hypothetical protein